MCELEHVPRRSCQDEQPGQLFPPPRAKGGRVVPRREQNPLAKPRPLGELQEKAEPRVVVRGPADRAFRVAGEAGHPARRVVEDPHVHAVPAEALDGPEPAVVGTEDQRAAHA